MSRTYKEILEEFEVYSSDVMYRSVPGSSSLNDLEEVRDESYRKYNLMSQSISWYYEKHKACRGWSRKKKRKINNRLKRYFRNLERRLK